VTLSLGFHPTLSVHNVPSMCSVLTEDADYRFNSGEETPDSLTRVLSIPLQPAITHDGWQPIYDHHMHKIARPARHTKWDQFLAHRLDRVDGRWQSVVDFVPRTAEGSKLNT